MRLLAALCVILFTTAAFGQALPFRPEIRDNVRDAHTGGGGVSGGVGGLGGTIYSDSMPTFATVHDHPAFLMKAGLRSSASTEDGLGLTGMTPYGTDATFSAGGVDWVTADIGYNLDIRTDFGSAIELQLNERGAIGFTLTVDGNTRLDGPGGHSPWVSNYGTGQFRTKVGPVVLSDSFHLTANGSADRVLDVLAFDDDFQHIIISWNTQWRWWTMNGIEMGRVDRSSDGKGANDGRKFSLGGNHWFTNVANHHNAGTLMSDFFILVEPVTPQAREVVLWIGDSLITQGCGDDNSTQVPLKGVPVDYSPVSFLPSGWAGTGTNYGCGFTSSGAYYPANAGAYNTGVLETFSRVMAESGRRSITNVNYSRSGAATHLITVDEAIYDARDVQFLRPSVIVFQLGINGVVPDQCNDTGGGIEPIDYENRIKDWLDYFAGWSVKRVILIKPHHPGNDETAGLDTQFCTDQALAFGAAVQTSANYANNLYGADFVGLADAYTATGPIVAHQPDSSFFVTDDIHFNAKGYAMYGRLLAEAVLAE